MGPSGNGTPSNASLGTQGREGGKHTLLSPALQFHATRRVPTPFPIWLTSAHPSFSGSVTQLTSPARPLPQR